MSANTWKSYFEELESNELGNSFLDSIAKATKMDDDKSEKEIISNICEDCDSIIHTASPILKKVKLYHSFANLGGTRVKPNNKIVALDGFGCQATAVRFEIDSVIKKLDFKVPSNTTLKAISDSSSVTSPWGHGLSWLSSKSTMYDICSCTC